MSIVHADNFSIYGTNTSLLLNGVYASWSGNLAILADPDGISSGMVIRRQTAPAENGAVNGLRYVLQNSSTTVGIATRVWLSSLPTQDNCYPILTVFRDLSNNWIVSISVDTTGRFRIINHVAGTTERTAAPAITADGWYHVEVKMVTSALEGSVEIRVEGLTVYEDINMNTGENPVAQVSIGDFQNDFTNRYNGNVYFKDFVVWDNSGTVNTDFLGSVIVHNLSLTSDVALNWTPIVGTDGYTILDNIPPDDNQYIYAEDDPLPSPYVGTLSDLPDEVTSVKALITFVRAAKSDGGDGSLQSGLISDPDGTPATALGADRPITVAQTYWRDVFEIDPKTGAPYLPEAVNDVQFRLNRTT